MALAEIDEQLGRVRGGGGDPPLFCAWYFLVIAAQSQEAVAIPLAFRVRTCDAATDDDSQPGVRRVMHVSPWQW